jgi:ABC-type amino acid transport substrate-binding protein
MVTRRTLLAALAGLTQAPPALAGAAAHMRIVTAHLPPLVLEHGGARPGALYELVQELCRRVQLAPATEFVPWPRALFLASSMPATAIFPLTRQPDREARFRWLAPLYDEHYVFLAPRGGRFDLQHPDSMKTHRITLIRGAAQGAILRELGYRRIVEANSVEEVHRFLLGGMADAAFGERNIIRASLKQRGAEQDFGVSVPVRSTTAWLAGSLDFPEEEAQRFARAMAEMHADGSARRILAKYGLD